MQYFSTASVVRVPHVLGTRVAAAPEFLLRPGSAGRIEHDFKTGGSAKRSTQGGEQRARGRRRHRVPEPLQRSSRSPLQGKIMKISAADYPRGDSEELEGGFLLWFPPSRSGYLSNTSPHNHTHRRWGRIGSSGEAADRGRRGGSQIMITMRVGRVERNANRGSWRRRCAS